MFHREGTHHREGIMFHPIMPFLNWISLLIKDFSDSALEKIGASHKKSKSIPVFWFGGISYTIATPNSILS